MIELSEEQRQQLQRSGRVRVRDPQTNETYVLLRADTYDRLAGLLDDLPSTGILMNEVMAEDDANDPYLESYQQLVKGAP